MFLTRHARVAFSILFIKRLHGIMTHSRRLRDWAEPRSAPAHSANWNPSRAWKGVRTAEQRHVSQGDIGLCALDAALSRGFPYLPRALLIWGSRSIYSALQVESINLFQAT
ncbi:hypothetical protein NDU88_008508 [Pleurodeles waltl]|uniref:Uncharacterized protein n=1 Tax=Pleurodeles waltl TaxID=8319 RepID=A0AAV7N563_PLEWA|nr:hypothetical protein NDU88_008508 [Pleurodeles waltl]